MTVIHHDSGIISFREFHDPIQLSQIAVHREHPVRGNHTEAALARLIELGLQLSHVRVGIAQSLGLAEPDPINHARMVERIADDGVAFV